MESPLKNRTELAQLFKELGFKIGAEIGVFRGDYSKTLLDTIPGLKLYGVDNWSNGGRSGRGRDSRQVAYVEMLENLKPYIESEQYKVIKKDSMKALEEFEDDSLDFVYIDANHGYEYVLFDIREWSKKVRVGGIVSGHDYYTSKRGQVKVIEAVNDYVKENNIKLKVTGWDNEAKGRENRIPNWYFTKEE